MRPNMELLPQLDLKSLHMRKNYPFSAIVAQDEIKRALLIAATDPTIGGVLLLGDRGTGKSTAVRALAALLPKMDVVQGSRYNLPPGSNPKSAPDDPSADFNSTKSVPVPVVDLPLGATEDRVIGALDLERALTKGEKAFEPGLLAQAHRGFLYIDEVNLLEDHLVDALLDVAASGENVVEREGLSIRHPAKFVLVGSGNPEEGDLRPQLLDRFGLAVDAKTPTDLKVRMEVVKRRDAYERDPDAFFKSWSRKDGALRRKITAAQERLDDTEVPDAVLELASKLCIALGTDGLRGELTLIRAARALAAFEGKPAVTADHLKILAASALGHRLRRDPLDDSGSAVRVARAVEDVFPA